MPQHALAVGLGALLAWFGNSLPDTSCVALSPLLLIAAGCLPRYRFALLLSAAYLWSGALLQHHLDYRLAAVDDGRSLLLRGRIVNLPIRNQGRIRIELRDIEAENLHGRTPRLVRLNWYQDRVLPAAGERWQFEVRLRQPRGLANFNGFDYAAWAFSRGVDAVGYVRQSAANRRIKPATRWRLSVWRDALSTQIERDCKGCANTGLFKALVLGERGEIDSWDRQLLRDSGTAHLLAISGLHVGLVAAVFYCLGRGLWRVGLYRSGVGRQRMSVACAVVGAFVYAALAGFSLPTQRALVMLICILLALYSRSRLNLLQSLSLAIVLLLLVDPRAVGGVSFWLSIGAISIIAFATFRFPGRIPWWRQLTLLQLLFCLLFAPIGALLFDQVTPASLPANLVAIPLISFLILPATLMAVFSGLAFPGIAATLLAFADRVTTGLMRYLEWLIERELDALPVSTMPVLLLLAIPALALLLMPGNRPWRVGLIFVLASFFWLQPKRLEPGHYQMSVFDVGMGTSVLVRTRWHSLVYDLGPGAPGRTSAPELGLIPELRRLAIEQPDMLIVSHVDQDHSGGYHAFTERHAVARPVSGTPRELRARHDPPAGVADCHAISSWRWDDVSFRFLAIAAAARGSSTNGRSCVLLIEGHHRTLLTGDIESRQEFDLLRRNPGVWPVDILLAPHHGSLTSSSERFVRQSRPRHVIFTASRGNQWNFPRPEVQARYRAVSARLYSSAIDGGIRFESGTDGIKIETANHPRRRIWRRW